MGAGLVALLLWFVACVLSVLVCLLSLSLFGSFAGYVL